MLQASFKKIDVNIQETNIPLLNKNSNIQYNTNMESRNTNDSKTNSLKSSNKCEDKPGLVRSQQQSIDICKKQNSINKNNTFDRRLNSI